MKWHEQYKVHYYYTDFSRKLKPSYIGRYMQETANYSLKNFDITSEFMIKNNFAFILSKIRFEYYAPIFEDDIIQVETWALRSKTTAFHRNYRIFRDGGLVAAASSVWALVNTKEKMIIRPENFKYMTPDMTDPEELAIQVQKRLKMPEDMRYLTDYTLRYSDIDHNMHMNNAVYIDLICDSLYNPCEKLNEGIGKSILSVDSIDISYNSEAVFGDSLEISKGIVNINSDKADCGIVQEHYIRGKNKSGGSNCFDAKVTVTVSADLRLC